MSILDTVSRESSNVTSISSARNTQNLPKAKVWLNVGADVNGKFINLPVGLPIDTMEPLKASGQNEEWLKTVGARNGLLEQLQSIADKLQPGQEMDIPLTLRLRRNNDEKPAVQGSENEFSVDLMDMLTRK